MGIKRQGSITKAEKALIAQVVMDSPAEITPRQVNALATATRRSRQAIKKCIEDARDNFAASAGDYVEIHKEATMAALLKGDNEQALKGSQWALTNISAEGARVVEKTVVAPSGSKIQIGIKLGGIKPALGITETAE